MVLNRGMFDGLFPNSERTEERDLEEMHWLQARDPFTAMAHTAYSGGTQAGQGLGRLAAAASGRDPRTSAEREGERTRLAGEAVRKALVGLQPGSDEFFTAAIKALTDNGMLEQASAVQEKWDEMKLTKARTGAYERQHAAKPPTPLKGKDFLLAKHDDIVTKLAENPEDPALQKALANVQTALKTFYPEKAPASKGWKIVAPTQDHGGYKINEDTGDVEPLDGRIARPEKPLTAAQREKQDDAKRKMQSGYEAAFLKAKDDYEAAVRLYNHPDLEGAVGPLDSMMSDKPANERGWWDRLYAALFAKPGSRHAAALVQRVKAGAFLNGFQEIKQASQAAGAQGAGFGALSDAEGARIANAKAALDAAQDARTFRVELKKYIEQMKASWDSLVNGPGGAVSQGFAPHELPNLPLTGGVRGVIRPGPGAPAPTAPVNPKVAPSDRVRVLAPDGKAGTIPRSQLDEAKKQGYTEAP